MAASPSQAKPLAAVILAGGESRRMGAPKALLPNRDGKTFVEHLIEVTRHPRVGITRIVIGAHADEISQKLRDWSSATVVNSKWQQGQLSSIQAGVRSLPAGETGGMILCPVDHPLISADLVARLIAAFDASGKQIALPKYRGRRGHPLIFRSSLYDELLVASPEIGARQAVWAHSADILEMETNVEGVVLNLNDPETLKRALENRIGD